MNIVIDGRMLFWTGVGRYTRALLHELEAIDQENDYKVLVRKKDWDLWEPSAPNFQKIECDINPYTLAEQWELYVQLRALKPDLVHFTAPNAPVLYSGRRVTTVHDLTLLDYDTSRGTGMQRWLRGLKRRPFRMVLAASLRRSTALFTPTEYVRHQIIERFGIDERRVHATLLAANPISAKPEPIERFGDLGRYLFYVGNMYPYKNVGSTIRAMALLPAEYDHLDLVIAGKRDEFSAALERQAEELGVGDRVKFLGYVSDGELVSLYREAEAYINPSLSEGFGLQGLEAMLQDVPVLSAQATCLPEVYGEAAEYFDPHDPADQMEAIRRVLDDDTDVDERLRKAGHERVKQFSWRRMAHQTLDVYRSGR
ncbi:MAG TPA: glycosyltransferase family 1 protein [Candidatus Saccharimonadia bacterium]|jgi:glycosyltransferase involved in cell wall biosynthesis|nr:glycosyltransferase family 1 protein [Candidatus Saccharimonadia bacterium]